jgi:predicted enzyme related to lactoylglutathione lyase
MGLRDLATGAGRGIDGQIWPSPPDGHSFVQLFIEVDDVGGLVEQATAAGARVLMPPQKLPQGEEVAILQDPEGISFGVYSAPA